MVYAACCSVMEVDALTGEYTHLSADIERDSDGRMLNAGTWDYKPPSALDIPVRFDVAFLEGSVNNADGNVLGSKATGEPAIVMGMTPFFALKMAIYAARA